ncbi:hypothetical protein Ddye_025835 [Dipteronia dyeriana]|uniref:Phorbol-ester/DAG-type domain-containing protein n=1 Tax=Dipteronia dyeriana TaxID=168575 RepID=A0AAD9WPZ3_9ROSI|nr:hypothetical protein Ddye_025835 [Dipteronia dyeriana]
MEMLIFMNKSGRVCHQKRREEKTPSTTSSININSTYTSLLWTSIIQLPFVVGATRKSMVQGIAALIVNSSFMISAVWRFHHNFNTHSTHPLHLKHNFAHYSTRRCRACRNPKFGSMLLSCVECNFDLHSPCAKTMKQLSLKHECHNHNLYFPFDLIMKNEDSESLEDNFLYCNKCHDTECTFGTKMRQDKVGQVFVIFVPPYPVTSHAKDTSNVEQVQTVSPYPVLSCPVLSCPVYQTHPGGYFYCCRECDINFHFECIPLPCDVKQKSHTHPLTLTHSPKYKAYYNEVTCDICKAGYWNAGHPIFLCAEGTSFVHIECAISERISTEDHCGRAELDGGNGNGSGKMVTLALELEALEEKHDNKESVTSLDQKISYLDPTTCKVMKIIMSEKRLICIYKLNS